MCTITMETLQYFTKMSILYYYVVCLTGSYKFFLQLSYLYIEIRNKTFKRNLKF